MNTRDYLSKAILRLLRKSPFYSTIIVKQNIVSDDTYDAPMATDGKTLIYNPDMIKEIPLKELTQVLMHEAMHVANKHHIRMKAVRPKYERKFQDKNINFQKIFNIAADLAINSLLCRVEYDIWKASEMLKNGCVPGEDFSHQQFANYPKLESSE